MGEGSRLQPGVLVGPEPQRSDALLALDALEPAVARLGSADLAGAVMPAAVGEDCVLHGVEFVRFGAALGLEPLARRALAPGPLRHPRGGASPCPAASRTRGTTGSARGIRAERPPQIAGEGRRAEERVQTGIEVVGVLGVVLAIGQSVSWFFGRIGHTGEVRPDREAVGPTVRSLNGPSDRTERTKRSGPPVRSTWSVSGFRSERSGPPTRSASGRSADFGPAARTDRPVQRTAGPVHACRPGGPAGPDGPMGVASAGDGPAASGPCIQTGAGHRTGPHAADSGPVRPGWVPRSVPSVSRAEVRCRARTVCGGAPSRYRPGPVTPNRSGPVARLAVGRTCGRVPRGCRPGGGGVGERMGRRRRHLPHPGAGVSRPGRARGAGGSWGSSGARSRRTC